MNQLLTQKNIKNTNHSDDDFPINSHLNKLQPTQDANIAKLPKRLRLLHEPIHQWLNSLSAQNYSQHTLNTYFLSVKNFASFLFIKNRIWSQCDKRLLTAYIGSRIEKDGLLIASVQLELSAIRHFYTWLIEQGKTRINPTTGYQLKSSARPLPNIADIDLLTQLLDQPPPDEPRQANLWVRDKAMFELLYSSGLRVSELVNLDLVDVDFQNKQLRVLGKGKKVRIVPFGNRAKNAIENYLPHRYLWQEQNETALFISETLGTRLTTRTVQNRLKVASKRAGIAQNLYPHLLRHCFASHMLSASGDLRAVQEMLGHSDIGTTQIYTHVDFVKLTQVYDKAHPRAIQMTTKNGS